MTSLTSIKLLESIEDIRSWHKDLASELSPGAPASRRLVSSNTAEAVSSRFQNQDDINAMPLLTLGFVPTMGALHSGHLTLIREAKKQCQNVIVSIFINPLQFGANEDFDKYPRSLERDFELCKNAGVDVVFHPNINDMYTQGLENTTKIVPPFFLTEKLCGAVRPGHFTGVATVVSKLFSIVEPDIAFFGEKDYQQLTVIRHMVDDLDLPVKIVGVPTERESDGLALSSRNAYLTAEQRAQAPILFQTLCHVKELLLSGKTPSEAIASGKEKIAKISDITLQYLEICDAESLASIVDGSFKKGYGNAMPLQKIVVLIAAKFGSVRLIDNLIVNFG